jgi:predicted nucleotidyltransferase component of viral defense system
MRFSRELLVREAQETGFRPEILEKALQLLHLLESFLSHPYLRDRLVLKGGTALNLFFF